MVVAVLADVEAADDVGVVQPRDRSGLSIEPLEIAGVTDEAPGQDLEGDPSAEQEVLGLVDRAHPAARHEPQQLMLAEEEPLVDAREQLLGLPGRQEPSLHERRGQPRRLGDFFERADSRTTSSNWARPTSPEVRTVVRNCSRVNARSLRK